MLRRDRLLNQRTYLNSKEKDKTFHYTKRQSYRGLGNELTR